MTVLASWRVALGSVALSVLVIAVLYPRTGLAVFSADIRGNEAAIDYRELQFAAVADRPRAAADLAFLMPPEFRVAGRVEVDVPFVAARTIVLESNAELVFSATAIRNIGRSLLLPGNVVRYQPTADKGIFLIAQSIVAGSNSKITWNAPSVGMDPEKSELSAYAPSGRDAVAPGAAGDDGLDGRSGLSGVPGADGPTLNVFAASVEGELTIDVSGSNGGPGGSGQSGGRGGDGAIGMPSQPSAFGCKSGPGRGGSGGNGGDGGDGGPGGAGGAGGTVLFFAPPDVPISISAYVAGGSGGPGGESGEGGDSGRPGQAGQPAPPFCTPRPDRIGARGRPGRDGQPGPPGQDGDEGGFLHVPTETEQILKIIGGE